MSTKYSLEELLLEYVMRTNPAVMGEFLVEKTLVMFGPPSVSENGPLGKAAKANKHTAGYVNQVVDSEMDEVYSIGEGILVGWKETGGLLCIVFVLQKVALIKGFGGEWEKYDV